MDCNLSDVIRITLATCNYSDCSDACYNYLLELAFECNVVFHNERYLELWSSLIHMCFNQELEEDNKSMHLI